MEGERVKTDRIGTDPQGRHKRAAIIQPTGPGEIAVLKILAADEEISKAQATKLLDGEMTLAAFIHRHDAALALWTDHNRIGNLAPVPESFIQE